MSAARWALALLLGGCRVDRDGDGYVGRDDCDDRDPLAYPGAPELCNGLDDDCDGAVDEDEDAPAWYRDGDGDGYGQDVAAATGCADRPGFVRRPGDCDDSRPDVAPGAPERCDGVDQDCDGAIDESPDPPLYVDDDADGFGDPGQPVGCAAFAVAVAGDCDDSDPRVYPGAAERCNGVDDDCDGAADDESDADGDGSPACADCDDADPARSPLVTEVCNGVDDDCDGVVDPPDAWWDARWPARLPIRVTDASIDPWVVDVDAGQALLDAGVGGAFTPGSLRVVAQDCGGAGVVELPAQWLDGAWGLDRAGDDGDPLGDGRGALVILYDTDGDLRTVEVPPAAVNVAVYLGGPVEPAGWAGGLGADPLDAAGVRWVSAPDRGGLFDLRVGGVSVASQAGAARGNGVRTPAGPLSAAEGAGALTWLDASAVTGALRVDVALENDRGAVDVSYTVRRFAGRPEAWVRAAIVASATTTVEGVDERTASIRPWQVQAPGGLVAAADQSWVDVDDGGRGVTWRWLAPPAWLTHVERDAADAWSAANDVSPCCVAASGTVAGGITLSAGVLEVWPRDGGDGVAWAQRPRPVVEVGAAEAR